MCDDEGGINLARFDLFQQRLRVSLHVRLSGFDGQPFVHHRAERQLVNHPNIHARDRDGAAFATIEDRLPQSVRAIGRQHQCCLHFIKHRVHAARLVRLAANRVDTAIRTAALRHRGQLLRDILFVEVDRLRSASRRRHREPLGHAVYCDHAAGAEHPAALDTHLRDGAASPHRDGIAGLDIRIFRSHPSGGEDVREKEHFLIRQVRLDLDRPDIGVRDAQIFRLPPGVAAEQMRIAKESRRCVAHQLTRFRRVRIRHVAAGEELLRAEEALAAGDDERYDDAVTLLEFRHHAADLDDDSHRLMAEHVAFLHLHHVTVVKMQIRPADRGGGDFDDRVRRFLNHRIGNRINADVRFAVPAECSHFRLRAPLSRRGRMVGNKAMRMLLIAVINK